MVTKAKDLKHLLSIQRHRPFDAKWYLKEDRTKWVLPKILTQKAEEFGDKPFLQYANNPPLSFAATNASAKRIANGLVGIGVSKGDRAAIYMPNSPDFILTWFGIVKAGAVMVPVNTAYKMDFLQDIVDSSDTKVLFTAEEYLERLVPIQEQLTQLEKVIVWTRSGSDKFENPGFKSKPLIPFSTFVEEYPESEPNVEVKFTDYARFMYTSGTTGRSKCVVRPSAADYYSARGYVEVMDMTDDDVLFTCLPLFHSNAQVLTTYPALLAGARVAVYERYSSTRFWKWIKESRTSVFNLLGGMAYFLWNTPPVPEEKEHRVRLVLASPAPHDILEQFMERFNLTLIEGYGLTETGVVTYMRPKELFRVGSCGKEAPGYEVKIVNPDTDEEVPRGEIGEIVMRPRIPNIMLHYYHKMPEKTVEDFRNFWFHTGDAGRMDKKGYIYFVDRVKDYIRRRGENISSFEVEKIVSSHPSVAESSAVGVKAQTGVYAEDEVMIVVVKKLNMDVAPEGLMKWCEDRMPYFMIPRFVRFIGALPKTPTERVQKHKLREEGITPDTWDREAAGYKIKR